MAPPAPPAQAVPTALASAAIRRTPPALREDIAPAPRATLASLFLDGAGPQEPPLSEATAAAARAAA
eukprot:771745-Lingulodinium_polyedra.AAC.1